MGDDDATQSIGAAVTTVPAGAIEDYWRKVAEALETVFNKGATEAPDMVREVRRRVTAGVSPDLQAAIYHVDPLQVAADLGGARDRPLTEAEKAAYAKIASSHIPADRPDKGVLKRDVPDDVTV